MVKVKARYGKPAGINYNTWYCKNFNILTTSKDRDKCVAKHIKKLEKYGFIKPETAITISDKIANDFCKDPFK